MHIEAPTEIRTVAWEGELVAPDVMQGGLPAKAPVVTLGRPEIWTAAEALETVAGQKWVRPLGGGEYWLLRLACTLREPAGGRLVEAEQRLYLRPRAAQAPPDSVYAHSLFPLRLGIESSTEQAVTLGPELTLASGAGVKAGEVGVTIPYRRVFPVIQAYGVGEAAPSWQFKAHAAHPLAGSQFVYAVVAARPGSGGARAAVELIAGVQAAGMLQRFKTPDTARESLTFTIP